MPLRLELDGITAGYGKVEVLHDLSVAVPEGKVVALLGPNGAGKTTTLKVISGTLPITRGVLRLDGVPINRYSAFERSRAGITLIPEGRGVFPGLSVADNLTIAVQAARQDGAWQKSRMDEVLSVFPRLHERRAQRAGTLSGGEQQMLAMSRALLGAPKVLLMDEISMGLAPKIVEQLFESVAQLREQGMTIVLVEQYLTYALRYADICYVLGKGHVSFVGEPKELEGAEGAALAGYVG
jgi:branched-chain amino acid transport system ATP-binding protein